MAADAVFSERYGRLRSVRGGMARETPEKVTEELVQCLWYDRMFTVEGLSTTDGRALRIVSPGWWNRSEGPDFRGAQIEFNGRLRTGDVEIHLEHSGWRQHGHFMDSRYDDVILHVVLDSKPPGAEPVTASGRPVPVLLLTDYLDRELHELADDLDTDAYPYRVEGTFGRCAEFAGAKGPEELLGLLRLAGEWRMLFKARALRERMDRMGADQAVYEGLLYACGFAHFKHHFKALARNLPYERARQLARDDAMMLEAAFMQSAGLFPRDLPEGSEALPHFARLRGLKNARLSGLRAMPLEWKRVGVRPVNYPERRLAGASGFLARTATGGLVQTLEDVWATEATPIERRRQFEELFPSSAMGFWGTHCTWRGKKMKTPAAPIGPGRVRSIVGNVFVPAGLAMARQRRDRRREERVLEFFSALPKEPENRVQKAMLPRIFGLGKPPKLDFRLQQGLLQMHADWCEPNPSCRNCRVMGYLDGGVSDPGAGFSSAARTG